LLRLGIAVDVEIACQPGKQIIVVFRDGLSLRFIEAEDALAFEPLYFGAEYTNVIGALLGFAASGCRHGDMLMGEGEH
jgi:hypothetical protein